MHSTLGFDGRVDVARTVVVVVVAQKKTCFVVWWLIRCNFALFMPKQNSNNNDNKNNNYNRNNNVISNNKNNFTVPRIDVVFSFCFCCCSSLVSLNI